VPGFDLVIASVNGIEPQPAVAYRRVTGGAYRFSDSLLKQRALQGCQVRQVRI
jgi:hypothetical protein